MRTQAHIVWKHRCEALHGKDGPSEKVHETSQSRVKEMYDQKENLRAQDKKLLDRPMKEVLAMNQSNMRAYIDQVGYMVNKATKEAIEYEEKTKTYNDGKTQVTTTRRKSRRRTTHTIVDEYLISHRQLAGPRFL